MYTKHILATVSFAVLALCNNQDHVAAEAKNQPEGAAYVAMLPNRPDTTIRGNITAVTSPDGKGVVFSLDMTGLPLEGGPFRKSSPMSHRVATNSRAAYHIHDQPVPPDGNCLGTLAHLDPYGRGEMPPCDIDNPQTCQVGDLAGKHGMMMAPTFQDRYVYPSITNQHRLTS